MAGGGGGGGPHALRLRGWEWPDELPPLSEFDEMLIAPARGQVLLRSRGRREALLLPLASQGELSSPDEGRCPETSSASFGDSRRQQQQKSSCVLCYIGDVDSVAWGCYGDAYDRHVKPFFREFLIASNGQDILVHGFRGYSGGTEAEDTCHGDRVLSGECVEWGSLRQVVDGDERSEWGGGRRRLRSYLVELDASSSNGGYVARFPDMDSLPRSAEVVSFSIYRSTLNFSELSSRDVHSRSARGENASPDLDIVFDITHESVDTRTQYKCSRVFSSSSHHLIGVVLTSLDDTNLEVCKENAGAPRKTLVVVVAMFDWGIQWFCSVDLRSSYLDIGLESEWVDFQFSDNLLICLNSSGLIHLYDAKNGNFVAHCHAPSKDFKRLAIFSSSMLVAAIDRHGIIYVTNVKEHLSETQTPFEPFSCCQDPLLGVLSAWKFAGAEIGTQKVLDGCGNDRKLPLFSDKSASNTKSAIHAKQMDEIKQHPQKLRSRFDAPLGSFAPSHAAHSQFPTSTLRRVFLPIDGFNTSDSVCFSNFGVTRLVRSSSKTEHNKIVHTSLHVMFVADGRDLKTVQKESSLVGDAIGCCFRGSLYFISQNGLFVALPSLSLSLRDLPCEFIRYWQPGTHSGSSYLTECLFIKSEFRELWSPWQIEVIDRAILYEGPEEANHICLENGWDMTMASVRRMQLALHYLHFEEVERSLEMLLYMNLAEEGVLKLLFASAYQIFCKLSCDNEVVSASRYLSLAACFATKMIRRYGLLTCDKDSAITGFNADLDISHISQDQLKFRRSNLKKIGEMSYYLEIIRNIQRQLTAKQSRQSLALGDATDLDLDILTEERPSAESSIGIVALDESESSDVPNGEKRMELAREDNAYDYSICVAEDRIMKMKTVSAENPKDMMNRWVMGNLDLTAIVRDALYTDRLPLAVLQLHLKRQDEFVPWKEPYDTFNVVRDAGRAIAYGLFLKGESGLAITTLQRLGEDVEICLRQLLFGTVRRTVRAHIAEEMKRFGYLKLHEMKLMETISHIESLYPSSCFSGAYKFREGKHNEDSSSFVSSTESRLFINVKLPDKSIIECGDIDGVVLGFWVNACQDSTDVMFYEDVIHTGYWAAAAVWSDAWDQRTIDRIMLDRRFLTQVHIPWESKIEYYMAHNNWQEVDELLDILPASSLLEGILRVNLEGFHPSDITYDEKFLDHDLDPVYMIIPNVKILKLPVSKFCPSALKMFVDQKLAQQFIFLKEHWKSMTEIISLFIRSGLIMRDHSFSLSSEPHQTSENAQSMVLSEASANSHCETRDACHKLFIHHCLCYNLPYLLDLYLDHHQLFLDKDFVDFFQEAAGERQWAKWLLFARIKGCEYDASFSNARSIFPRHMSSDSNACALEVDHILLTVDDMAEGVGEIAALATLMHAPLPIQKCLCFGGVIRHHSVSSQCTLENLRHGLQQFPTLWRTLVAACFGQDTFDYPSSPSPVIGKSALTDYLSWRDAIFSSSGGDTSLLQMLPSWFPKPIRRLVRLFVQGPPGWQSMCEVPLGESFVRNDFIGSAFNADENFGFNVISWETAIQRSIEKLYSSHEESKSGIEHHLHRGRALAAFNHLLGLRAMELKSTRYHQEASRVSTNEHSNVQSDAQMLLEPCTLNERSLISSVIPLAIMHFEDLVLVSSCAFLLELCGLSANMIRLDVAVLRRISLYCRSFKCSLNLEHVTSKSSALHVVTHEDDLTLSLARALADDYLRHENLSSFEQGDTPNVEDTKRPSRALMTVLHNLEKASLPLMVEGKTCGYWLSTGIGDGLELRSQQKAASHYWSLVTTFCNIHHLPLSTEYLAVLAKDNDWVGFLAEAQIERLSFETVNLVAEKEFSDPRLKMHVITVLKSMQSKKNAAGHPAPIEKSSNLPFSSASNNFSSGDLFGLIAECEPQKNPGTALLVKAKNLRWSLLALIASCFPDASAITCLTVWLEITAARETSSIKVDDIASQIARNVDAAVQATNSLPIGSQPATFHYNRKNPKRRRQIDDFVSETVKGVKLSGPRSEQLSISEMITAEGACKIEDFGTPESFSVADEGLRHLSNMVAVLCEQQLFLPLLRAFEMFLPSCSLLPFIRFLQAFSQMRLSEASAHLASFSARIKEEPYFANLNPTKEGQISATWMSSTAVKAADAVLKTCPSPYEKRSLLKLLTGADFGNGGSASSYYRKLFWKIEFGEPLLCSDDAQFLESQLLDDHSLLLALEKGGRWEEARDWAKQLDSSGSQQNLSVHHVTEMQAEAMVAEWKEFLWDVPEERASIWSHCQTLFLRHAFPALQAGKFFLKHAESIEKDIPPRELHEMLILSLQWLSGTITQSNPVYPLPLLREIETRVWLLAVESEAQYKTERRLTLPTTLQNPIGGSGSGSSTSIMEQTASVILKMDNHINAVTARSTDKNGTKENSQVFSRGLVGADANFQSSSINNARTKRRSKFYQPLRRTIMDTVDRNSDEKESLFLLQNCKSNSELSRNMPVQEENIKIEPLFSGWEERIRPAEFERAILSLLEFGQVPAARQLQQKLSPEIVPFELVIVDTALKLASSSSVSGRKLSISMLDTDVLSVLKSYDALPGESSIDQLQALESLTTKCSEGCGRGLCNRIIAVLKSAEVLCIPFSEAFEKRPSELLQLLSLKAQDSLEEARILVETHVMPPAVIARVLAESFLKGLLAAHRGGYMDSQTDEGPAPLLWRISDFLKWAELCPSESEIGHALMRMVITSQEIPHACEVELLILAHHFYKLSSCLDGVDVLVTLAANRVESYVTEKEFSCLARLITGVSNFHALNFILGILIENGQLDLLLQKYSAAETATGTAETVRGFRMAVLSSLKHFNPNDLDALATVYSHFDMKHETASLLELQSEIFLSQWKRQRNKDHSTEDLLEAMRCLIEAAKVYSTIDAGQKTYKACARASLISLQIRIPDVMWLDLSETNARRALVEQSFFQEALIVAEAYDLNQPGEWALVLWNQMLRPDLIEQFVADFVVVLPLQPSMLLEIARFYRAEVVARGDQNQFSAWLSSAGLPAEWMKYLAKSFRSLLKRTRDLRLRMQLATTATGFGDVYDACAKVVDRVPDSAGPLILRRGHGGAYLPLM